MEQRRPRLGDIVDDYCPRERRLSNHVIVAMIEDDIRQTRCTTCDAEHPYKGAKVPPRRARKEPVAAAPNPVVEAVPDLADEGGEASPAPVGLLKPAAPPRRSSRTPMPSPAAPPVEPEPALAQAAAPPDPRADVDEEGPVHRPLIRATLPRIEGQPPTRQAPDFTMRLPGARMGPFRPGDFNGKGQRPPQGGGRPGMKPGRPHGKQARPQGGKPGRPNPNGGRPAFAHPGPSGHRRPHGHPGGKKRSR